jgi:hypothetical protein
MFKICCAVPIRDKSRSTEDRFHERIAALEKVAVDSDDALDRIKGTLKVYGSNSLLEIIKTSGLVGDMILLIATAPAPAKKSTPTSSKSPELGKEMAAASTTSKPMPRGIFLVAGPQAGRARPQHGRGLAHEKFVRGALEEKRALKTGGSRIRGAS